MVEDDNYLVREKVMLGKGDRVEKNVGGNGGVGRGKKEKGYWHRGRRVERVLEGRTDESVVWGRYRWRCWCGMEGRDQCVENKERKDRCDGNDRKSR